MYLLNIFEVYTIYIRRIMRYITIYRLIKYGDENVLCESTVRT